ncbi:MAG: endo-1,4-beta-xylanase [Clostridium sp.]
MKSSKITALILCFCLMLSMTACGSNNSTENKTNSNKAASGSAVTENKKTSHDVSDVDGPALKDLYAKYFMMGAAINGSDKSTAAIHHEGMANILKKHYNSTTLSNLMKPCYLLDEKACVKKGKKNANATDVSLNFDSCKESLDFCKENGIKMRGHTLVWHNQTPEWFFKKNYDAKKGYVSKKVMAKRMENYIKGVLEYCKKIIRVLFIVLM